MKSILLLAILAITALPCSGLEGATQPEADLTYVPKVYEARYQATTFGLSATAYRTQTKDDDVFTLQNSLTLTMLGATVGSVTEISEFRWHNDSPRPLHYRYDQTGISSRTDVIDFNWDTHIAQAKLGSKSVQMAIPDEVLDRLNFSLKLGRDIAETEQREFTYQVADGNEVDTHVYRIEAEETITTPAGDLRAVRLDRVRRSDSKRRTTVWLATDWDYLLVKLEQVSSSGTTTELTLKSAIIEGETLTGL